MRFVENDIKLPEHFFGPGFNVAITVDFEIDGDGKLFQMGDDRGRLEINSI